MVICLSNASVPVSRSASQIVEFFSDATKSTSQFEKTNTHTSDSIEILLTELFGVKINSGKKAVVYENVNENLLCVS